MDRLALNLRLDEERIAQLLGGGGDAAAAADTAAAAAGPTGFGFRPPPSAATASAAAAATASADIAGRLLGCYGDLFTASLDTGFRPAAVAAAATAAAEGGGGGGGGGGGAASGGGAALAAAVAGEAPMRPCAMLTVASNDITRLRVEVEGLWFQSSVSPRLAVRCVGGGWETGRMAGASVGGRGGRGDEENREGSSFRCRRNQDPEPAQGEGEARGRRSRGTGLQGHGEWTGHTR